MIHNSKKSSSFSTKRQNIAQRYPTLTKLFKKLISEIKACLNLPTSDEALKKTYKARQYHAVVQQLPLSSIGNMITSLTLMLTFWGDVSPTIFVSWFVVLWTIALVNIGLWLKLRSVDKNKPLKNLAAECLIFDLSAAAVLHVSMAAYLFGITNEEGRLLLTAVVAAFVSTGSWMFSFLPVAGLAWVFIFCVGTIVALPNTYVGNYAYLVMLVSFFGLILSTTVLVCSRMFLSNLDAETKLENQRQVMGFLLNDFEENASDWLWETNRAGRLQHTSIRLAQIMNTTQAALDGQELSTIISSRVDTNEGLIALSRLARKIRAEKAFKNVSIPITLHEDKRWWSLTAKPLTDNKGNFIGWRGVGSDVTDAKLREKEMLHLANTDSLTNLANRHQFNQFLGSLFSTPKNKPTCTLMLIGLDNFKMINDSLGHTVGDLLLQEVAKRLTLVLKPKGILARLGGDEFAIAHASEMDNQEVSLYAEEILQLLNTPWDVAEHRIEVFASIGIAFTTEHTLSGDDLFKFCDLALYSAKDSGKGTYCFFDKAMEVRAQQKLSLLSDMKKGLSNNEFVLHYQPQVNLHTGELTGFEALVRWQHPTQGLISPIDFITLAEESGFIHVLGEFILKQACIDALTWPEHLQIAVNFSPLQFNNGDIFKLISHTLSSYKLAPERLEIELTESAMITDIERVLAILKNLQKLGVRIALDDFGTGYSSLSYLQKIPLDKLKIDRSFVLQLDTPDNVQAMAVLQCILSLAESFNFETTVEGVELAKHINIFRDLKTTYGQGFYYARPADAEQTLTLIEHWQANTK